MSKRETTLIGFLLGVLAGSILPAYSLQFNRFVNYTSVLQVNDFAIDGNVLWVASSGGLYRYDCTTKNGTLYSNPVQFPDLDLTSLGLDSNHTLWIGTNEGYLYERSTQGRQETYSGYVTAGWKITRIVPYDRYLIIGSIQGCSIFDTVSHNAIQNAAGFGPGMPSSQVYAVAIYRDTLLLGCVRGLAKLAIGGSSLQNANFFDPSIWTIDSSYSFAVKALIVGSNGFQPLPSPAAMLNDHVVSCTPNEDTVPIIAQGVLAVDGVNVMTLPSMATTIVADTVNGRRRCLIGTLYNYFYFWDGIDTVDSPIDGPCFSNVTKVYIDREGLDWACAGKQDAFPNNPWWEGISVLKNNSWQIYSPARYPSMEGWGGAPPPGGFKAAVEDQSGRMWFGSRGGQVKRYDRGANSWLQYCPGVNYNSGGMFTQSSSCGWGLCDAIARDSAGFMWIASWRNYYGALLCYDPRSEPNPNGTTPTLAHFRYLYPLNDSLYAENYNMICVDVTNNIILGEGGLAAEESNPLGKFLVISYNGNPLTSTIVCKYDTAFGSQMSFIDAVATRDSLTFIATSAGFFTYSAVNNHLQNGLRRLLPINAAYSGSDSLIDTTLIRIQALVLQDDRYLWLGTADSGLIQYDLTSGWRTTIGMTQGLISNDIQSLAIDRINGMLWIGTDKGVSRYSLGYSSIPQDNGTPFVYPNPFSKHRHQFIAFEKLPPASKVCIYTLAGTLVAIAPVVSQSVSGSACAWTPPAGIVPGIYFYTIQSAGKSSRGRFIITP